VQQGETEMSKDFDADFAFVPNTQGLGSKVRGNPKVPGTEKKKSSINQLDQIFLCDIFKVSAI